MQRIMCLVGMLVVCLAGWATAAPPQGPAFDCAKAKGEVEQLICRDATLAALDRKLDQVYRAVSAKANGQLASTLRQEQRGWVSGRNDCWKTKEQTWITATWTVDTVPACIEAQYRLRISELQALWRLVPPRTVAYTCQNNAANEVVVGFFATDPSTIRLERGDRTATLWQVGEVGTGKYEGQNVSLVHQGSGVQVNWLDTNTGKTEALRCTAR